MDLAIPFEHCALLQVTLEMETLNIFPTLLRNEGVHYVMVIHCLLLTIGFKERTKFNSNTVLHLTSEHTLAQYRVNVMLAHCLLFLYVWNIPCNM